MSRVLLAFLLILLTAPAAFAEGKITADPNAPGSAPTAAVEEEPGDERLAQKVTYEATKKMVVEILDDLAKKTGVTLKAGANNVDWQVRDRRMNVFAKDVPLARLMSSIARVMHFKWSKSGDKDAPTYRLFADQRTLRESEAQRERDEKAREQRQAEKRKRALEAYEKTANMSPEELAKLKQENPLMYVLASQGMAGGIVSFMKEAPGANDALSNGQRFTMSGADLSPAGQQAVLTMLNSMNRLEKQLAGDHAREMPGSLAGNLGKVTIDINKNLEMATRHPGGSFMLGEIALRYSEGEDGESISQSVPILDPDSALTKLIGKALIRSEETGQPMQEAVKEIQPELMTALAADMTNDMPSAEPKPEQPPDPDLEKKIKMDGGSASLDDVLGKLSTACEFAVVSDSFARSRMLPGVVFKEGDLRTVLDKIGEGYLYNWEKHGPVIEFRDKDWLRKRAAQIPETWLEYWRSEYKTKKTLDVAELAKMAALTIEQLEGNISSDNVLRSCYYPVISNRDILKLYACLTDAQRQMLSTELGLNLRSLGPNQWPLAETAIQSRNADLLRNPDTPLMLTYDRRKVSEVSVQHELSLGVEGIGRTSWSVGLPEFPVENKPEQTDKKPTPPK